LKTRHNVAEAAGTLARSNAKTTKCWNARMDIIRYLKETIDEEIV